MSKRLLPDWIDSFMEFTNNSEPPLMYRKWCAISTIAAVLQRKCSLVWGSLTFYPNMYIILVGPSGKARKGTAMGPAKSLLNELEIPMAAEAITREALIREMRESTTSIIDTATSMGQVEFHSSLTVFSPELTVFLGHNNFQLMSDLTDWYDCAQRWKYRTKNQGTDDIVGVWVNLIGATTPDLIRTALPLDAIGGGLTSRMIFVFEPRKGKNVPCPFLTDAERSLRQKLKTDLERMLLLSGTFKVTSKFVDRWVDWYPAQEDKPPFQDNRFAGYFERRPTHVMKLSMIMSASRSDDMVITHNDLDRAIQLLTDTEVKMPQAFTGVGKLQNADILSAIMIEIGQRQRITYQELMSLFYQDVDQRTMDMMIKTLQTMKFVKVEINKTGQQTLIYTGKNSSSSLAQSLHSGIGGNE